MWKTASLVPHKTLKKKGYIVNIDFIILQMDVNLWILLRRAMFSNILAMMLKRAIFKKLDFLHLKISRM